MNIALSPVRSRADCRVAVIGAGPYGLAAAAHLRAANVSIRVFGEAMAFWRRNMPKGMKLRSPWIATHIADPFGRYLLDDYFRQTGLSPPDRLPVEAFIDYGIWFQERVAPDLDSRRVVQIAALDRGFRLVLDDGENFFAEHALMATGLLNHEHRPAQFDGLPRALVSHSCEHTDSDRFRGRQVAVIGRGQSACESAALLHEAGADVEIICRGGLVWNGDPDQRGMLRKSVRSLLGDALIPPSQVGPFPLNWLVEAPGIVSTLPGPLRDRLNRRCLGATAALWLRDRLRNVPVHETCRIVEARRDGDRVALTLDNGTRLVDHVLLATGYRIDLEKMNILDPRLRARIARHDGLPSLSAGFQSSVDGLHFVGSAAVASFGPLLRFIAGAGFAARRVTQSVLGRGRGSGVLADNLDSFQQQTPWPLAAERKRL
ncbi:MAG TPA: FAD-dependent oxidoreductase [Xanthobacteraceae bacterium]|nr:FAD-dependent oxidoreductase [Xanthobacteraceae bacterium]